MRAHPVAIALLLLGCESPRARKISIELPPSEGFGSAMIAIESDSGLQERVALALADPAPIEFPEDGGNLRITALYYRAELSNFRLKPGPVLVPPDSASSQSLPKPDRIETGVADRRSFGGWMPLESLPPRLDLAVPSACPLITARGLALTSTRAVRFIIPAGPLTALVGMVPGSLIDQVSLDQASVFTANGGIGMSSAWRDDSGTLWFGSYQGDLFALRAGQSLQLASANPSPSSIDSLVALDGAPSGTTFEMVIASLSGTVERYDGQQRKVLRERHAEDAAVPDHRVLLWLGPSDLLYSKSSSVVIRVTGMTSTEILRADDLDKISATRLADGSVIVGGWRASIAGNEFWRVDLQRSTAEPFGSEDGTATIRSIAPAGEGFVFFDSHGFAHYWDAKAGFCPPVEVAGGTALSHALAFSPTQVLAGGDAARGGQSTEVQWVEIRF